MKSIFFKTAIIIYCFFCFITSAFSQQISGYKWEEVLNIPVPFKNVMWLDVFFLKDKPDFGWICGYGGNVLRTTDGGNSWAGIKIEVIKIDTIYQPIGYKLDTNIYSPDQLESLSFANEKIGYVSGEFDIFKTTDGGTSWEILPLSNNDIWGNFFISADTGLAVGGGCGTSDGQHFYRTTNGGQSWSEFVAYEQESGLSDAILFSSNGLGYASSSGMIWRTINGGITWDILCITGGHDWQEDIAVSGNTILVPFSEGCYGGGKNGGLRLSTDLGISWNSLSLSTSMFGVFLLDSMRGWGVGEKASIFHTYNGGLNWYLLNSGIPSNSPFDDIWFINDTIGWIVGRGVYKFTGNIVVDVNDNNTFKNLVQRLSPNPVENEFLISFNNSKIDEIYIKLYNLTGNIVLEKTVMPLHQNDIKIDLSNINSGLYFLQVQQGTNSEYQKIVKYK